MTHRPTRANRPGTAATQPATRLARKLGVGDAVVIGLGSMIGAGIFAALGPAAGAAGTGMLIGLLVAALVAYCNATSSAALAALYPESGGTYVYGRERLSAFWGFLAGWGFVVGKLASCAAMALTFAYYAAPSVPPDLPARPRRLVAAITGGRWSAFAPAVRIGATVASLGVLLSLLAGISRTAFAMAGNGDLPKFLASVHPRYRIPDHAELLVGVIVAAIVPVADIRGAIGFSSFAVLVYYAIANASALTLRPEERRWPRAIAAGGLAGCGLLAFSLPLPSVFAGAVLLAIGAAVYAMRQSVVSRKSTAGKTR